MKSRIAEDMGLEISNVFEPIAYTDTMLQSTHQLCWPQILQYANTIGNGSNIFIVREGVIAC
ncbi:hypothetical protein D3C87_1162260 [compost metagenome]